MKSNIKTNSCYMYRMEGRTEEQKITYKDEADNIGFYETLILSFTEKSYDILKKRQSKYTEEELSFEDKYELMGRLIALKKLYL